MTEATLRGLRATSRRWVVDVMAGPNMAHLGQRDPKLFGSIASFDALRAMIVLALRLTACGCPIWAFPGFSGKLMPWRRAFHGKAGGRRCRPGWPRSVLPRPA